MSLPHLQIIVTDECIPVRLTAALDRIRATTTCLPLQDVLRAADPPQADAFVVVAADTATATLARLRILLDRLADRPRAVLLLSADGSAAPRIEHPPVVPVLFDAGTSTPDDLAPRLSALLEMRRALAALQSDVSTCRAAVIRAARRYSGQLRLASKVQRELMPTRLPEFPGLSFSCVFRPLDYVSGDFYDVQRLDDEHVGIALADATGHGIPAALLTVLVKRALRGRSSLRGPARLLSPSEVLAQLNAEILDANLAQCRFVAATYALLNTRTLTLRIARGGAPYPLLRRAAGEIEQLQSEGGIIGVMPDMHFETQSLQLEPGDELVFATDGMEPLVAPTAPSSALAAAFGHVAGAARRTARALENAALPIDFVARELALTAGPGFNDSDAEGVIDAELATAIAASTAADAQYFNHLARPIGQLQQPHDAMSCPWMQVLRERGARVALDQLRVRYDILRRLGQPPADDVTVLSVHVKH